MDDNVSKLLKSEIADNKQSISQKRINVSKRRLSGICRSLMKNPDDYDPKKTVSSISSYLNTTEKVDRLLYSVISGIIVSLDEGGRGNFSTNVDKLLQYVLDDNNTVEENTRKICIKLYDHFQLNIIQIENANSITKEAIDNAMKDEIEESHKEIKGIQKEYITILGIFAAIMLAFVGAFTFSTSVLSNLGKVSIKELVIVSLVIGLVFILLITVLIEFLREINDKTIKDSNGKRKIGKFSKMAVIVLFAVIFIAMVTL